MRCQIAAVVILDAVAFDDLRPDHFDQLLPRAAAMEARGNENQNLVARDAGRFERRQQGPQNDFVGHRSREIADGDAHALSPARKFRQGGRTDRQFERFANRRVRIGKRFDRVVSKAFDDVPVGQLDFKARSAVFKTCPHERASEVKIGIEIEINIDARPRIGLAVSYSSIRTTPWGRKLVLLARRSVAR
jgi:hypothetical protein